MEKKDQTEIPVRIPEQFEIPGLIQFDFSVERRLENPVDFNVKIRSETGPVDD